MVVLDKTSATVFPWRILDEGLSLRGLMNWNSVPMGSWADVLKDGRSGSKFIKLKEINSR